MNTVGKISAVLVCIALGCLSFQAVDQAQTASIVPPVTYSGVLPCVACHFPPEVAGCMLPHLPALRFTFGLGGVNCACSTPPSDNQSRLEIEEIRPGTPASPRGDQP